MDDENSLPIVWYFADPMCSWCWGFSPVISRIRQEYANAIRVSLNLGGLRPGTTEPISDEMRNEILHHWKSVNRLTGQSFMFDNAMPEGFIYDTEPPSRAVMAFARLQATKTFEYFSEIQSVFYRQGKNVTQPKVLATIAGEFGLDEDVFLGLFDSNEAREATQKQFLRTRQAGVQGFPTLVWYYEDTVELLTAGYMPYETLATKLDGLLAKTTPVN